jgi:hypothetical protein
MAKTVTGSSEQDHLSERVVPVIATIWDGYTGVREGLGCCRCGRIR